MRKVLLDPEEIERRVTDMVLVAAGLPQVQFVALMNKYAALLEWLHEQEPGRRTA